jgi:glucose uptake protein GlcU
MQRFQTDAGFVRRHALLGLTAGAVAFCCVVALVLVDLAISRRSVSELISQTVWAELGELNQTNMNASPRFAQPPATTQTARAN